MRSGKRNIPVEFLAPSTELDDDGLPMQEMTIVRRCWASFEPFRGGELSLDVEVESQETAKFIFDYFDVMSPDKRGLSSTADLVLRISGQSQFWDIDVVHPDLARQKSVEIIAIAKRLPV